MICRTPIIIALLLAIARPAAADDPMQAVEAAVASANEAGTTLAQQTTERNDIAQELARLSAEWLDAANALLQDPAHRLRRQIIAASEIPHPTLLVRDNESLVIQGGATRQLAVLPYGLQPTALTTLVLPQYRDDLMTGPPEEVIEFATRKHLIKTIKETETPVKDDAHALATAIALQERGELAAGRHGAFVRLLEPLLALNGPLSRLLQQMAHVPEAPADGLFPLHTKEGPLQDQGRPIAVGFKGNGALQWRIGTGAEALTFRASSASQVADNTSVPPLKMLDAVTQLVKDGRARSAEHLQLVRSQLERVRAAMPRRPQ